MHPHKNLWSYAARLSRRLGPPGVLRVTPVDTLKHVAELGGGQAHRALLDDGPDETPAIEALGIERQAQPVMPDDLDEVAALAPEDEEIAGMGIAVHAFLDLKRQALHPAPHIGMAGREPHSDTRGDRDHRSA